MNRIFSCFVFVAISLAAHLSFAGAAWYSKEIETILKSDGFESHNTLDTPVEIYGIVDKDGYWLPPHAVVNTITGEVIMNDNVVNKFYKFTELNEFGKYDAAVSAAHFIYACKQVLKDEFNNEYYYYSEDVAAYYSKYETINMTTVVSAFDTLKAKFRIWLNNNVIQTTSLSYDTTELINKVKEISKALADTKTQIANTIKQIERNVENVNKTIVDTQVKLSDLKDSAIDKANASISSGVKKFQNFVGTLTKALESGDAWRENTNTAIGQISEAEQEILDAIEKLEPYKTKYEEVQSALATLESQRANISSIRVGLVNALKIEDEEEAKAAVREVLGRAEQASIVNCEKAMGRVNNAKITCSSQIASVNQLQGASIAMIGLMQNLMNEIDLIGEDFNTFVFTTMDNLHGINAYLGSTNSMQYIIWRETHSHIEDASNMDFQRWLVVSQPDKIDDAYGFGAASNGGRQWNFIYSNFASTYSMWAWPLVKYGNTVHSSIFKFMEHFGLDQVDLKYKGFYELENDTHTTTNWYARGITAPANWADGVSIVVTNGKFKANSVANNGAFEIISLTNGVVNFRNAYFRVGGKTYSSPSQVSVGSGGIVAVNIEAAQDSPSPSLVVYSSLGAMQQEETNTEKYVLPLYTIQNGMVMFDWRTIPTAVMGEY